MRRQIDIAANDVTQLGGEPRIRDSLNWRTRCGLQPMRATCNEPGADADRFGHHVVCQPGDPFCMNPLPANTTHRALKPRRAHDLSMLQPSAFARMIRARMLLGCCDPPRSPTNAPDRHRSLVRSEESARDFARKSRAAKWMPPRCVVLYARLRTGTLRSRR
jgi:hypothetical protein